MPRVAVIGVHGVGSPPEYETARAVADLLCRDHETPGVHYTSFCEQPLTIPTEPLRIPAEAGTRAVPGAATRSFEERLTSFRTRKHDRTVFRHDDPLAGDYPDVAFMRDQLSGYESDSECLPYRTVELTGGRHAPDGVTDVHVFEMHWADLSRVGTGALAILGAIYQLVLHLAHIGRKMLDVPAGVAQTRPDVTGDPDAWTRAAAAQARVVRLFTVAVPVATMLVVAFAMLFIPAAVAPRARLTVAVVIIELALLLLLGFHAYFRDPGKQAATRFVVVMFVAIAAGIAAIWGLRAEHHNAIGPYALSATVTAIVFSLYIVAINAYDLRAPGALPWGVVGLIVALVGMAFYAPRFSRYDDIAESLRHVALAGFQFSDVVLIFTWLLTWAAATVALIRMMQLSRALRASPKNTAEIVNRGRRATFIAKVTFTISAFSFIFAALVGYQSLTVLAGRIHNTFNLFPRTLPNESFPLVVSWLVPPHTSCPAIPTNAPYDDTVCAQRFFDALVAQVGTGGLPVALITITVALLMISWFVALVAVTSLHVPKSPSRYAENLGLWVTNGFVWLRRAGTVMILGLSLALLLGLGAEVWYAITHELPWGVAKMLPVERTSEILQVVAVILLASAATFGAAKIRLEALATHARPGVGIVLDVDNYLRESPVTGTPRAKMAERFTSLLRLILRRKNADGTPYFDRIVIVSHSQGTIIASDLLRFLTVTKIADPDLSSVDIRLLTMGCPLRQLYSANFPHLYRWIDRTDSFGDTPAAPADDDAAFRRSGFTAPALEPPPAGSTSTLDELSPSPLWLRIRKWVCLYTTGDYVGRTLWRTADTPNVWRFEPPDAAAMGLGRRERCLGDGTHTRYWTSIDVAQEIDMLISEPASAGYSMPGPSGHPSRTEAHR